MRIFSAIKNALFGEPVDHAAILKNGGVLIDVRTPSEYNSGHAKGSKNIPLLNLSNQLQKLKGKEVILVCRSGARAGQAKGILTKSGITAHNAGAWQKILNRIT